MEGTRFQSMAAIRVFMRACRVLLTRSVRWADLYAWKRCQVPPAIGTAVRVQVIAGIWNTRITPYWSGFEVWGKFFWVGKGVGPRCRPWAASGTGGWCWSC